MKKKHTKSTFNDNVYLERVLDLICASYSKTWTTNWTIKCMFVLCYEYYDIYYDIYLTIDLYRLLFDNVFILSYIWNWFL